MSDHATDDTAQIVGAAADPNVARVWQLATPLCEGEGMTLVYVEFLRDRGGRTLRLFLDKPGGVTLDDCVTVSRQLGDILDVGLEHSAAYRLEVSSPGINRPLGRRADFETYKGRRVRIRCAGQSGGRTKYTGTLIDINELSVQLIVDNTPMDIPFAKIVKANLLE